MRSEAPRTIEDLRRLILHRCTNKITNRALNPVHLELLQNPAVLLILHLAACTFQLYCRNSAID